MRRIRTKRNGHFSARRDETHYAVNAAAKQNERPGVRGARPEICARCAVTRVAPRAAERSSAPRCGHINYCDGSRRRSQLRQRCRVARHRWRHSVAAGFTVHEKRAARLYTRPLAAKAQWPVYAEPCTCPLVRFYDITLQHSAPAATLSGEVVSKIEIIGGNLLRRRRQPYVTLLVAIHCSGTRRSNAVHRCDDVLARRRVALFTPWGWTKYARVSQEHPVRATAHVIAQAVAHAIDYRFLRNKCGCARHEETHADLERALVRDPGAASVEARARGSCCCGSALCAKRRVRDALPHDERGSLQQHAVMQLLSLQQRRRRRSTRRPRAVEIEQAASGTLSGAPWPRSGRRRWRWRKKARDV